MPVYYFIINFPELHHVCVRPLCNAFYIDVSAVREMGNTVSAAERVAETIVHPVGEPSVAATHHHGYANYEKSGVPPPECPMHQQQQPPKLQAVATAECPVGYGKEKDEINPLNMVSHVNRDAISQELTKFPVFRCPLQIKSLLLISRSRCPPNDKCRTYQNRCQTAPRSFGFTLASRCFGMQC